MILKDICLRCGRCCHARNPQTNEIMKCQFLRGNKKKFFCSIYEKRIGKKIIKIGNKVAFCGFRINNEFNYKGCPYNKLNKNKTALMLDVKY